MLNGTASNASGNNMQETLTQVSFWQYRRQTQSRTDLTRETLSESLTHLESGHTVARHDPDAT